MFAPFCGGRWQSKVSGVWDRVYSVRLVHPKLKNFSKFSVASKHTAYVKSIKYT